MSPPKSYRSFAEFEREYLRGSRRLGLSIEEMVEDACFERHFDFDADPFDAEPDDDDKDDDT